MGKQDVIRACIFLPYFLLDFYKRVIITNGMMLKRDENAKKKRKKKKKRKELRHIALTVWKISSAGK